MPLIVVIVEGMSLDLKIDVPATKLLAPLLDAVVTVSTSIPSKKEQNKID